MADLRNLTVRVISDNLPGHSRGDVVRVPNAVGRRWISMGNAVIHDGPTVPPTEVHAEDDVEVLGAPPNVPAPKHARDRKAGAPVQKSGAWTSDPWD